MAAAPRPPPPVPLQRAYARLLAGVADPRFLATAPRDPLIDPLRLIHPELEDFDFIMLPNPPGAVYSCTDHVLTLACALEQVNYVIPLPSLPKTAVGVRDKLVSVAGSSDKPLLASFPIYLFMQSHGRYYWQQLDVRSKVRADSAFIAFFPDLPVPHATVGFGDLDAGPNGLPSVWYSPLPPPNSRWHWRRTRDYVGLPVADSCNEGYCCLTCVFSRRVCFCTPVRRCDFVAVCHNYDPFGFGLCYVRDSQDGVTFRGFPFESLTLYVPKPVGSARFKIDPVFLPHDDTTHGPPQVVRTCIQGDNEFYIVQYRFGVSEAIRSIPSLFSSAMRGYAIPMMIIYGLYYLFIFLLNFTIAMDDSLSSYAAVYNYAYASRVDFSCRYHYLFGTSEQYEVCRERQVFKAFSLADLCSAIVYALAMRLPMLLLHIGLSNCLMFAVLVYQAYTTIIVTRSSYTDPLTTRPLGIPARAKFYRAWQSYVSNLGRDRLLTVVRTSWKKQMQIFQEANLVHLPPDFLQALWERAANEPAFAMPDPLPFPRLTVSPGCCSPIHYLVTGKGKNRVRHHWCKACRRVFIHHVIFVKGRLCSPDDLLTHHEYTRPFPDYGYLPLYSLAHSADQFVNLEFDPAFWFRLLKGQKIYPATAAGLQALTHHLHTIPADESLRGRCCGPFVSGVYVKCFTRGTLAFLQAICTRVGSQKECRPVDPRAFEALTLLAVMLIVGVDMNQILPETREEWFSHFDVPEKREKMLQAKAEIEDGMRDRSTIGGTVLRAKAFTKMEKSLEVEWCTSTYEFEPKAIVKPRVIISPHPHYLYLIGPYAHRLTKLLASRFDIDSPVHYAGCDTPDQLNQWLGNVVRRHVDPCTGDRVDTDIPMFTLEADVRNMDCHHSEDTFNLQAVIRRLLFGPNMPADIDQLFEMQREVEAYCAFISFYVKHVLPSGVPNTSWSNSVVAILCSLYALSCALAPGLDPMPRVTHIFDRLFNENTTIGVAGDDTWTVTNVRCFSGASRSAFVQAYVDAWAACGFPVKLRTFVGSQWRRSTFLAMRPIWTTLGYQWAVEPGRRLRAMFWQLDCTIHPIAWARAVAISNKHCGHVVPVFDDILDFVLSFSGPTARPWKQPGYVWNDYVIQGTKDERTYTEFCETYRVTMSDIYTFRNSLMRAAADSRTPVIPIRGHVIDMIMDLVP